MSCYDVVMSKESVSCRVTPQVREVLQQLADEDARTVSWVVEMLVMEALQSRGLLPAELQQRDLRLDRWKRQRGEQHPPLPTTPEKSAPHD